MSASGLRPGARSGGDATSDSTTHLGVLVGDPTAPRVVALSTVEAFTDPTLLSATAAHPAGVADSGFQAHLYTRPGDTLVVRVPALDADTAGRVATALAVNDALWRDSVGVRLVSRPEEVRCVPVAEGGLLDAAVTLHRHAGGAFLAFVYGDRLAAALGDDGDEHLRACARTVELLRDKNVAMQLLAPHTACAATWVAGPGESPREVLRRVPRGGRYVFKPAGGAGGVGVFTGSGRGASHRHLRRHVDALARQTALPSAWQVQRFLRGDAYGVSAWLAGDGGVRVLEIHAQRVDRDGRFRGGTWTRAHHSARVADVEALYRGVVAAGAGGFRGLVCLDVIDGCIVEVNPRVTASAPVTHLLVRERALAAHLGPTFRIRRIDLRTRVPIPFDAVASGALARVVRAVRERFGVLVLPQGLDPFGPSRVVFVNDDARGSGRRAFLSALTCAVD